MTAPNAAALDRFNICLPFVLAQECPDPQDWSNPANYSNNQNDPGGQTFCGITARELDQWRLAHDEPIIDVRQLEQAEGYEIYLTDYWQPTCPLMPPGLDLCLFDTNVNQGTGAGMRILQVALAVPVDGIWGPITQTAVTAISSVTATIEKFTARREVVYQQTRNFAYFGTDWMRRAEEIGAAAERAEVMKLKALAMYRKFMASKEQER